MHKRKTILLNCDYCGKEYHKHLSEYTRNQSKGKYSFCSCSCASSYGNMIPRKKRVYEHLRKYNNTKTANPFLYYMKLIKQRFKEVNITAEDLKAQWELQKGICPYSDIHLVLASHIKTKVNPIYRASVDRIDSSIGYVKGNIQFVSTSINYMKNIMTHEDTVLLCELITKKYYCTLVQDWTISSSSKPEELDAVSGN